MSDFKLLLLHKVLVVSVNLLVFAALTLAMYLAAQNPEEFTLVFLKVFGGALIPVLVFGFAGKWFLRRRMDAHGIIGDVA